MKTPRTTKKTKSSSPTPRDILTTLENRFSANMPRHKGLKWESIKSRILAHPKTLKALELMESTGGEPDCVMYNRHDDTYVFIDCAAESPLGRRSLCYDHEALTSRKANKPKNSARALAHSMGCELLDEEQYRTLQALGEFDSKTSSWILTPDSVRKLGGALFCDRRFGQVFVYHNGAESYYGSRGFRCVLIV